MSVKFYEFHNMLPLDQLNEINNYIYNNCDRVTPTENGATSAYGDPIKFVDTKQIQWRKIKQYFEQPYNYIIKTINDKLGYLLHPYNDFNYVNYNVYSSEKNHSYGYHLDECDDHEPNSTKGTILINLSDEEYKGGQFHYWHNGEDIHISHLDKPGSIIYLKPNIYHKVDPVVFGTRKTISMFLTGPRFV